MQYLSTKLHVAAIAAATTLLLLAATACGESPSQPSSPSTAMVTSQTPSSPSTTSAVPPDIPSVTTVAPREDELQAAADKIGCTGYTQSTDPAPYVDRWGICYLGSARIQLYYIPDDTNYKAFMNAVSAYGVTEAQVVRVGSIVAAPDDATLIDQIRTALES